MKKLGIFLLLALVLFSAPAEAKKKSYDIGMAAIFRNEAPWLREWIEYHMILGVKHFYLYNNLSTDNYKEVLQPYINRGVVELIEWPHQSTDTKHWTRIQTGAYNDAIKRADGVCNWLAVLDLDEFIVPVRHNNLMDFLKGYERYGGVCIHWQMFGTSNITKIPSDKTMIETLILKAADTYDENRFVKSIFHPHDAKEMTDPHKPIFKRGKYNVNTRHERTRNSNNLIFDLEHARINHYWSRDEEYFLNFKKPRRESWNEGFSGMQQRVQNINQVQDGLILRFVPELRRRLGLD